MKLPKLTESIIRAGADAQSFQRGQAYYRRGAISNATVQGSILTADCDKMCAVVELKSDE